MTVTESRGPTLDEWRAMLGDKCGELNDLIGEAYEAGHGVGLNLAYKGRPGLDRGDSRPYVGVAVSEHRNA